MNIDKLLVDIFKDNVTILKKIQSGFRSQTYLIKVKNTKYIFQLYMENTKYQAKKKYDILEKFTLKEIPKSYKYGVTEEYSYLISEYIEGKTLTDIFNDKSFKLEEISYELMNTLSKIHSITRKKEFGWITDDQVLANPKFIDYIKSEYKRLLPDLEILPEVILKKIVSKVEDAIKVIEERTDKVEISNLCWYDINADNIIVGNNNGKYYLKGLLDPGGARYGIAEWDLAFIKIELLKNDSEFNAIIKNYEEVTNKKVDLELLNALSVIVELNNISFVLVDRIKLPIPYHSKFKTEFEYIYNNIEMN